MTGHRPPTAPQAVTAELAHHLVAGCHAAGITDLAVAAHIAHHDHTLLIAQPGIDFIDHTWQRPTSAVLPGETLTDAVAKTVAAIGLTLADITDYLGHHHTGPNGQPTRVFDFAVTVTDPDAICHAARIGHWWAHPDDLPDPPDQPPPHRRSHPGPPTSPAPPADPPWAAPLRAGAHGLRAAHAGTELLIGHAAWLHRRDFCDRFVRHHPDAADDTDTADIDWPAAITALNTGQLPCSASQARMLRLAASLTDGIPLDLRDALTGLDSPNIDLVNHAVLDTAGR